MGLAGRLLRNGKNDARHAVRILGDVPIRALKRATLEGYRNLRRKEGAASSCVKREIKTLRSAHKWARSNELIPDRELPRVAVKVVPVRTKYNPTVDEVWRVIDAMSGWPWFVASMMALTGARIGEIASLRAEALRGDHLILNGKTGPVPFP